MTSDPGGRSRLPLRAPVLLAAATQAGLPWTALGVVASTGSTNADAAAAARAGAPEGWALLADEQTAGRGRLARAWASPQGTSISLSVVLRPDCPEASWGWLPLLTGLGAVDAIRPAGVRQVALKWPNDVVVPDGPAPRKLAGILLERVSGTDAVVVGIGVNVGQRADELPVPGSTSVALEAGHDVGREGLAAALLVALHHRYTVWRAAAGDAEGSGLRDAYLACSATVGRAVRVELGPDSAVTGTARDVDGAGRLVLDTATGRRRFSSGDVVHVRADA